MENRKIDWDKYHFYPAIERSKQIGYRIFDAFENFYLFLYCYWHWILIGAIAMFLMWEFLNTGNILFFLIVLCLPFIFVGMNRGRTL